MWPWSTIKRLKSQVEILNAAVSTNRRWLQDRDATINQFSRRETVTKDLIRQQTDKIENQTIRIGELTDQCSSLSDQLKGKALTMENLLIRIDDLKKELALASKNDQRDARGRF